MAKKRKSAFDSKIPKRYPQGWSQDWQKFGGYELIDITMDAFDTLTPEDRLYLLYSNSRCMTLIYNRYHDDLAAGGGTLEYQELSNPTFQKRFIEEWIEFEESLQPASEDIGILVRMMIVYGHMSPALVHKMLSRHVIDALVGSELNDEDFLNEEYAERLLACYKNIRLSDYDRLLMRDDIENIGKEFLLKQRMNLEQSMLSKVAKDALEDIADPRLSSAL